ncbi:MAG TPA: SsrA-binding protein SmpB [Anaeromyxobacteraceae bacterium]|nr:SsrA-binding protein SmpB [Anaeromyxobacteraceae bacterium]
MRKGAGGAERVRPVAQNKRARFDYEIEERIEAGLVLQGSEVKSLRDGNVALSDAYATVRGGELWLVNCRIGEYKAASFFGHAPLRDRKLLVSRAELGRLRGKVEQRGYSLVPLAIYFKDGWAKVELALARGKTHEDRRRDISEREQKREIERALSRRRR